MQYEENLVRSSHDRIPRVFPHREFRHEKVRRSDEAADVRAEHEPEADDPESRRTQCKIHDVLHDDITGVFSPGQACLAHGKARLHKKDQRGSQQHPDGVRGRITLG